MVTIENELLCYSQLNSIAEPKSAVFFGADCFAALPVSEMKQDFCIDMPVYNRSIPGLLIDDSEKYLADCVYKLDPSRIFVNLGDADLRSASFDLHHFLSAYEWLLYTLHSHCRGRIYVVSVVSDHPMVKDVNDGLRKLARSAGCDFIDITSAARCEHSQIRIFEQFRSYLHANPISFADAFRL